MKKKRWLILAASLALAFGTLGALAACNGNSSQSGSEDIPDSGVTEEMPGTPGLQVDRDYIVLTVGDNYTLTAKASGVSAPTYSWAIEGNAAENVVMLTESGNGKLVVTGVAAGETKLVVSTEIDGEYYWKTVTVYVNEQNHIFVDVLNFTKREGGYATSLSTVENPSNADDKTEIQPQAEVYSRGELVEGAEIIWESADETVVKVEKGKLIAVNEGQTQVIGTYTQAGKETKLLVDTTVYRPQIALEEKLVIEVENLQDVLLDAQLQGSVRLVTMNGQEIGSYSPATGKIAFEKGKMPKKGELMGDNRTILIETDKAYYAITADVYTMIIDTKAELDEMGAIAKACEDTDILWNGYFVLGADIEYNGIYKSVAYSSPLWYAQDRVQDWANGLVHGFAGVFDGKGHVIDGLSIDEGTECGGFFGVLNAKGVIKNVAFTNASVSANSGFICVAGAGTVENVYVRYASVGSGAWHPNQVRYTGTFFSNMMNVGASVTNCVVDLRDANFFAEEKTRAAGITGVEYQNVYVIGGSETIRTNAGVATAYANLQELATDKSAQMNVAELDETMWSTLGGIPLPKAIYEKEFKGKALSFGNGLSSKIVAGTECLLVANQDYVHYSVSVDGVTVNPTSVCVNSSLATGTSFTVRAESMFDAGNFAEHTFTVVAVTSERDFTAETKLAYVDTSVAAVDFADFQGAIANVLYYIDMQGKAVDLGRITEGRGTLKAVTATEIVTFNYNAVTKILYTAEDLSLLTMKKQGQTIVGNYALGGNIDASDTVFASAKHYWDASCGFMGTLDGRGYTISNLTVNDYGIFGNTSGATIKNIRFENATVKGALMAYNLFNTTVENVSVTLASGCSINYGILFQSYAKDCILRDILIDASKVTAEIKCAFGVAYKQVSEAHYPVYENVRVVGGKVGAFAKGDWNEDVIACPAGVSIPQK